MWILGSDIRGGLENEIKRMQTGRNKVESVIEWRCQEA